MNARIVVATFIFIISVLPNACLVEQAIAWVATAVHSESHGHSHGGEDAGHHKTAPSHSHDEEGHEVDFCCDNPFNFYYASQKKLDFKKIFHSSNWFHPTFIIDEGALTFVFSSKYRSLLFQPIALRHRDRFALSSLLRSPPFVTSTKLSSLQSG